MRSRRTVISLVLVAAFAGATIVSTRLSSVQAQGPKRLRGTGDAADGGRQSRADRTL
jgi:hypothetical protein